MSGTLDQYLWIAIAGGIVGFIYTFGIGANDVANAFATSVASKSLTLKQAVVIATICEFSGALFLGASVTSTVRGKIFNADLYEDEPEIVMLGMFTSLTTASLMMLVATYFGLPVSTTHTIIGCIIGFSIAAKGFDSVNWNETKNIFISWVTSPLITGFVAFVIFAMIRYFILLSNNPFSRGYYTFSLILFITLSIDAFFIFNKGTKNFTHFHENVYDDRWVIPTCLGIGAVVGLLWLWPVGPLAKRRLQAKRDEREAALATRAIVDANKPQQAGSGESIDGKQFKAEYDPEVGSIKFSLDEPGIEEPNDSDTDTQRVENRSFKRKIHALSELGTSIGSIKICIDEPVEQQPEADSKSFKKRIHTMSDQLGASIKEALDGSFVKQMEAQTHPQQTKRRRMKKNILIRFEEATFKQNLEEQAFQESKDTQQCWQAAETYDAEVEELYTFVQAFTAALSSFAHGANDVANSIAPIAAIIYIYRYGELNAEAPVNKWILAYGGFGIVLGLLLYGYKVMKTIGYKLTALSPTRGSTAGLASSLVVATASYIGIPVSTTQCIVGAVAGIGLVEGRKNVQWASLAKVCISWIVIFFVSCILSAGLFAAFAYSPSLTS
ncbi:hypothetical protein ACHAWO_005014 [Cyclotella atomus]|uniref:Phosphate transporter n=1 Tax=Cyclotella atomus TaxID=382360 RepID=A0ABD3PTM9_9STRA